MIWLAALSVVFHTVPAPPGLPSRASPCGGAEAAVAYDRPVDELRRGAKSGNAAAQFQLGLRYELGIGLQRDVRQAFLFYRRAARQQEDRAYTYSPPVGNERVGRVIAIGNTGVPPDAASAAFRLTCLKAAVDQQREVSDAGPGK